MNKSNIFAQAPLEGSQGGQLTPLEFENFQKRVKIELLSRISGILTSLLLIPNVLTPLSEIPNIASILFLTIKPFPKSYLDACFPWSKEKNNSIKVILKIDTSKGA